MGAQLKGAFAKATNVLKKATHGDTGAGSQRGGTCGLYSLWYASIMIRTFKPERPEIWPRKMNMPGGAPSGGERSLRTIAKTVGSGQGELLNLAEAIMVIYQSGYECDFSFSESEREAFITKSLDAERPILLPYLEGGAVPPCYPAKAASDPGAGAHWALLYDESATDYTFIDPHFPNTPQTFPKQQVLVANALVDDIKFDPEYKKEGFMQGYTGPKVYKLGDTTARARLKTLLIALY